MPTPHELSLTAAQIDAALSAAHDRDQAPTIGEDGLCSSDQVALALLTKLEWSSVPSSATDTGTLGDVAYDSGYVYVCTATDTWKRTALATW